jgi:peptidoglycan/LPS O-acetylase OafA/YrhL
MAKSDRFYTLDALRGIAAILVALYHVQPRLDIGAGGHLAVDIFFGLSGIVIAQNYGWKLRDGLSAAMFMKIRFIRLYPLFLVGNILGFIWIALPIIVGARPIISLQENLLALGLGMAMLPSPSSILPIYPLNGPAWTLLFELLANAAFACAVFRWRRTVLVTSLVVLAILLFLCSDPVLGLERGGSWRELHIGLARVAYSFTAGVLVYDLVLRDRVFSASYLFLVPLCLAACLLLYQPATNLRGVYDWACVVLVFPALLIAGAWWNTPRALRAIAEVLGDISYPLYVTHYTILLAASSIARRMGWAPALWVPIVLAMMLVAAFVLGRWYDVPARRWLTRQWLAPVRR